MQASWISQDDGMGGDIPSDDATGAHHGVFTDGNATQEGCIGSDGGSPLDERRNTGPIFFCLQTAVGGRGAGKVIVDKHHAMTHEDSILQRHTFTYERVTLNLAVSSDHDALLNLHEGADSGKVTDGTTVEIDESVELDMLAEFHVRGDSVEFQLFLIHFLADPFMTVPCKSTRELGISACLKRRPRHWY